MPIPKMMWRAGRARKRVDREPNGRPQRRAPGRSSDRAAVYIMEVCGRVKIGLSRDPGKRLRQIQNAQPDPVHLVPDAMWMSLADAVRVERAIHKALAGSRFHSMGEWYFMDRETAAGVVARTIERCGVAPEGAGDYVG
jgi:hypothetical protein